MLTADQALDVLVRRGLSLVRVANGLAREVDAELSRLVRDLRPLLAAGVGGIGRRELLALLRELDAAITARFGVIASAQDGAARDLLAAEAAFAVGALQLSRPLSETALEALQRDFTVLGTPVRPLWAAIAADLSQRIAAEVRNAAASNTDARTLLARTVGIPRSADGGQILPIRRRARAVVDTTVQSAGNNARLAAFRANGINALKWHAILDSRVCPSCGARAGKLWDLDGKPVGHSVPLVAMPPAHLWCRCIALPLKFPEGKPPADGGPEIDSFDEWLKTVSADDQADVLGKGRADLYRRGVITVNDLINQAGRVMTLAELKAKT